MSSKLTWSLSSMNPEMRKAIPAKIPPETIRWRGVRSSFTLSEKYLKKWEFKLQIEMEILILNREWNL